MSFVAGQRVTAASLNGNSVQLIKTVTLAAISSSLVISIPSGYSSVWLTWQARTTSGNTNDNMNMQLNADTGAHYSWQIMAGLNTTVSATPGINVTSFLIGTAVGGAGSAGLFATGSLEVTGTSQGVPQDMTITGTWYACWSNTAATSQVGTTGGQYASNANLSSVTFLPAAGSLAAGCVFSAYGAV